MDDTTPAATPVQDPPGPPTAIVPRMRFDIEKLVEQAIEKGDVEVVERMLAMAERIKAEGARDAFNEAVSEFQRRVGPIRKTERAEIRSGRGSYDYTYAPLEEILRVVLPLMGELGLSHRWRGGIAGQNVVVNCRLSHVLGHFEESGDIPIPIDQGKAEGMGASAPQRIGIATTYGRRYTLLMVLGLNPEDDPDAQDRSGGGSGVKQPQRREQPVEAAQGADHYAKIPDLPPGSVIELRAQIAKIEGPFHSPASATSKWTRHDLVTVAGDKLATFDTKLPEAARGFGEELVAMTCKNTGRGWTVSEIWAAAQPPAE